MADNNRQPPARVNRGRQRVPMAKMANESNLQVTFSKRRAGLFKKASELCTLCGAEIALVVFSPGKKVLSFGHPSVGSVIDRYLGFSGAGSGAVATAILRELNEKLTQVTAEVEAERKRGEEMSRRRNESVEAGRWWEAPAESISDEGRLRQLGQALEELKRGVSIQTDRIVVETTAAANAVAAAMANPVYGGGGFGDDTSMNNGNKMMMNNNNMDVFGRPYIGLGHGFY